MAIGGRTGRDGIHGATFSSAELTSESETLSGGAVQIGNAITEKMVLDVLLAARDRGLFNAITDCGAGGFSSAVGEMGEEIGAEVWLDRVPLKYEGLSYTEIWISEAQERMVLSVPPDKWHELRALCASRKASRRRSSASSCRPAGCELNYHGDSKSADLSMEFLHDGRPPVVREAVYTPAAQPTADEIGPRRIARRLHRHAAYRSSARSNVCSKEWVIRQYDHEVQGGSVIKPLVGVGERRAERRRGGAAGAGRRGAAWSIACGMNPRYGDFDTYHMAASAIDEAMRNCVAVGADPSADRDPRQLLLGRLRAARDARLAGARGDGLPRRGGGAGHAVHQRQGQPEQRVSATSTPPASKQTIAIPPSLLISAMGQVDDVGRCVTMDLKQPGNVLYLVGETQDELGGSHFALVERSDGRPGAAGRCRRGPKRRSPRLHRGDRRRLVRACHDLSEGGLAVAAAEMAFAGGFGAWIDLSRVPADVRDRLDGSDAVDAVQRIELPVPRRSAARRTPRNSKPAMTGVVCAPASAKWLPSPRLRIRGRKRPSHSRSCDRRLEGSLAKTAYAGNRNPESRLHVASRPHPPCTGHELRRRIGARLCAGGRDTRHRACQSALGSAEAGGLLPNPLHPRRFQLRRRSRRGTHLRQSNCEIISSRRSGRFKSDGKLILGICNGFQILAKSGLLLADDAAAGPAATLTWNAGGKFEDRWVHLAASGNKSPFLAGIERMYLPIAHAEGKFVARDEPTLAALANGGQLVLRYVADERSAPSDAPLPFPANPNGSQHNVAGVCDETGRVLGLMPHPERYVDPTQHPRWTRGEAGEHGDGLRLFQNAVRYFR